MTAFAPLFFSVLFAFLVEASVGFGSSIVTVALGSFWFDLDLLLPAFVPVNLVLSGYLAVRYRRHIDRAFLVRRVLPFMGLGLPLGLVVFSRFAGQGLKTGFGAFVALLSSVELWRALRPATSPPAPLPVFTERLALLGAGITHGAFGTGGPLAVYVGGRTLEDKATFRATLSVVWLVLNAALVTVYAASGLVSAGTLKLSLWLVPALAGGVLVGEWAHRKLALGTFRIVVFTVLLAAGALLLARG